MIPIYCRCVEIDECDVLLVVQINAGEVMKPFRSVQATSIERDCPSLAYKCHD